MNTREPGTPPQADPRAGANPGYDEANPRTPGDVPRHAPDARGNDFGKRPNPESGGLRREQGDTPDVAADTP